MKTIKLPDTTQIIVLLIVVASMIPRSVTYSPSSNVTPSTGSINYLPRVDIVVNSSKVIGINNLSLGFMLDWEWKSWRNNSIRRGLARDANFKLVRLFSHRIEPCTYWNESTKTGTFNWTDVDALVQEIFGIGAEPLVTLGWATAKNITRFLPLGMAVNPRSGLPYPESYAAYSTEWIKHFKALNFPVRYYEIMNEPANYFGYNPPNQTRLRYYVEVWNAAARAMRTINPHVLLSQDSITLKGVLEYWIQYGDDVDTLNFHKYDSHSIPSYDDATMLVRAETYYFETTSIIWGVEEARQMWLSARGKLLPIMNTESNFNSAWKNGTDPRIQQMVGSVWTALVLRMGILKGLSYNVYYSFSSGASFGKKTPTEGAGFGMVNSDNNKPWYPYYVNYMIGKNLDVGDLLMDSTSSSDDIRVLTWVHNGIFNVLIISKVNQPRAIYLFGLEGKLNFIKIDTTISWENATLQTGIFNSIEPLIVEGYTVALLQKSLKP